MIYRNVTDSLNIYNLRNIRNTPKRSYNCAGYALNTFSWYCPRKRDSGSTSYSFNTPKEAKEKTNRSVKQMLADFTDLRLISSVDELKPDEYAILFRHSSDGDFHFLKRGRNGIWYNKQGGLPEILICYHPFEGIWNERYDGPIVMFAKKFPIDK